MDWNDKVEMEDLRKKSMDDELGIELFHDYVLEHLDDFDAQDWDIFISLIELVPDKMKPYIEFYTKLYSYIKDINWPGMKIAIRFARLEQICEEDLKIKQV